MLPSNPTTKRFSHHRHSNLTAHHAVQIPPPTRPASLLLIARWKGLHETGPKQGTKAIQHRYELVVRPEEPIIVGRCVRILATSPIAYSAPDTPTNELDTYDPHVVGRVVEIWRLDEDRTKARARITNVCRRNNIRVVELDLPLAFSGLGATAGRGEHASSTEGLGESGTADDLRIPACIRPAPVWRECLGEICWNRRRDLAILNLV
ncbi:hypothetical protein K466DRAFT_568791 [Polyporus arcularius HHB13444]|uniref:Uncharacterized protein n=1 Tax=Polyporus arcularius HHB13444 TaxID=1314778 RepID=A0A5C3P7R9_9APHY|nr:hypothetical protein K466DRAFT_568791 [Polyporus arcularius HHB13444]